MKITVLMLAALLSLSGCILVPEDGRGGDSRSHDRGDGRDHEHDRDHDRHCDHEGRCDHRHD